MERTLREMVGYARAIEDLQGKYLALMPLLSIAQAGIDGRHGPVLLQELLVPRFHKNIGSVEVLNGFA